VGNSTLPTYLWFPKVTDFLLSLSYSRNPYWKRRWTIQEFVLARDVIFVCGSGTIDLFTMVLGTSILYLLFDSMPLESLLNYSSMSSGVIEFRQLQDTRTQFRPNLDSDAVRGRKPLLHLLDKFNYRVCSNERDRIFSLLSLAVEQDLVKHNAPDYSLSTLEVFTRASGAGACTGVGM
jgi:hypothetical protein